VPDAAISSILKSALIDQTGWVSVAGRLCSTSAWPRMVHSLQPAPPAAIRACASLRTPRRNRPQRQSLRNAEAWFQANCGL
jgi:hypothetical protein